MKGATARRILRLLPVVLALVIFLAPWGGGGTSSLSLLVLHSLILASVAAAFFLAPADKPPGALWAGVLFTVWCLVGALRATYGFGSFTTAWDIVMALGVFWVAWRVGGSRRARGLIVSAVVAAAVFQAVVALIEGFSHPAIRSAGSFVNPNRAAAFLNIALCLVLARARSVRQVGWIVVSALLVGVQFWPVASRGGLAAMVLVGAAFLIAQASTRRSRWVAATVAVGMMLAASAGLAYRFAGPEDVYRYARLEMWRSSWSAVTERPVAGLGPGMFEHVSERYNFPRTEGPVRFGKHFSSTHNQYLEVLVETGAVGLIALLTFAVLLGAGILRRSSGAVPGDRVHRRGVLLSLAVVAVHGFVEPLLLSPAIALTLAILAGSALARPGQKRPPLQARAIEPRLLIPGAFALAGLFYAAVAAPYLADRHFGKLASADSLDGFRRELIGALRHNPFQPYYYQRAARRLLAARPVWSPASYALCYNYASKAVVLNGNDPWLHVELARVSRRGSQEVFGDRAGLVEALAHYRKAVTIAVTDPRPAAELAAFLLGLGLDQEAAVAADKALAIEPHFLDAHRLRIAAYQRLGSEQLVQARHDLEESRALTRSYQPANDYEAVILNWREGEPFEPEAGE